MPIPFTCPHCGVRTDVDERYAGQSGPCANCGQTIVVPSPAGRPAPSSGGGSSKTALIIVLAIMGSCLVCGTPVGIALLLPAVQAAREAARRAQCSNNLKQISIALANYHDVYKSFPPAFVPDANGKPMHSWRVLILPYMNEQALYDAYDMNEPWDGPNNTRLAARMPAAYACPSHPTTGQTMTNYVAVVGSETVFNGGTPVTMTAVTDGTSNTILVVEGSTAVNWMEPRDLDFGQMNYQINAPGGNSIGSDHPGGVNAAFADGSVQFLPDSTDPQSVRGMLTKAGGEPVTPGF